MLLKAPGQVCKWTLRGNRFISSDFTNYREGTAWYHGKFHQAQFHVCDKDYVVIMAESPKTCSEVDLELRLCS